MCTAICGGSAIAGHAPITNAGDEDMAVSLAQSSRSMQSPLLAFPMIGFALHLTRQFGLWARSRFMTPLGRRSSRALRPPGAHRRHHGQLAPHVDRRRPRHRRHLEEQHAHSVAWHPVFLACGGREHLCAVATRFAASRMMSACGHRTPPRSACGEYVASDAHRCRDRRKAEIQDEPRPLNARAALRDGGGGEGERHDPQCARELDRGADGERLGAVGAAAPTTEWCHESRALPIGRTGTA